MRRLLSFLFNYRAFIVFALLEIFCVIFIASNTSYQETALLNSSNDAVASVMKVSSDISNYFYLKEVNESLSQENSKLRKALANRENASMPQFFWGLDTASSDSTAVGASVDSILIDQKYAFLPAKVINNSVRRIKNSITIDKGARDGVKPGMGVICPEGVVGKVKYVSSKYAVITSLLHTDMMVSSLIKRNNELGTTQWDGREPSLAKLMYVPRHIDIVKDDTIVTSGYSGLFPKGILVGRVSDINIEDNATFYDITVGLSTPFSKLAYVYIVENKFKSEQDSLEQQFIRIYER